MPYSIDKPPDKIKDMPKHAQEIFIDAFNNALKQYEGDEERANKVAYAAVKQKYEQKDGEWVAKEAVHPHGEHVCVCPECKEEVTVGAGIKCNTQTCPKCKEPMVAQSAGERRNTEESMKDELQAKYAEIIQEKGKRNAHLDAGRIKKILELCKELLSNEVEDEDKTKEALAEATSVLEWLKLQETMKPEEGGLYPASAFAYVPDRKEAEGWKLRLWEDPEKKVTKGQLAKIAAALSPGGYKGHRISVPKEALAAVKRKIRAEYRKLDIADEDMPRWVQESETRHLLFNYTPLDEADVGSKGVAKVVVIKPGFGNPVDNHYYPPETLSRDYPIFEGAKMYADHQTKDEEKERPEGSIRQWVASLKNVRFEEGVGVVGDAVIIEPWLQQKLATLRDQKLLSEMGISIRAAGVGTKGKIDGKEANVVERITQVRSVDFVTEAGAGGGVLLYETEKEFDIDIISLGVLRERRPDLVKTIENEVKETTLKEVKKTMELEDRVKELEEQIGTLTNERDEAVKKITEAEKAQRVAEAKSVIDKAISEAELPEAAKAKLTARFEAVESADGIEDAIKAEIDYVNALKEASKPRNLGPSDPNPEDGKKALTESFKKLHPEWTDEQVESAVKGR